MSLIKCPRCELNYMNDTDEMCSVCRREVRGESEQFEMIEMCSECGENPAMPGQELCIYCLKERARRSEVSTEDVIEPGAASIEIDSVSGMDEIELDLHGDLDGEDFGEDAKAEFGDDEEDDDEDDENEEH